MKSKSWFGCLESFKVLDENWSILQAVSDFASEVLFGAEALHVDRGSCDARA